MAMGLFQILKEAFTAVPTFDDLNDEFYDGLEEALILADVGADTAADTVAQLRKRVKERFIGRMDEVKDALRDILKSKLEVGDSALVLEGKPAVVLVIGVNGVGKTTSIGKLAKQLKDQGKKVLLCAGDTFRAAAAHPLGDPRWWAAPVWISCGSMRARIPARYCLMLCRRPRHGAWTWCCATPPDGCTTNRT